MDVRKSYTVAEANRALPYIRSVVHEIQESLAALVFGGVLARFPKLRIVSAENDIGWLPHFIYRMDHAYKKWGGMWTDDIPQPPSEYMRQQVWATFQDDPVGPRTHDLFGAENYMWASDFPHSDSTFPESRAWIERNFEGVAPSPITMWIVAHVLRGGREHSWLARGGIPLSTTAFRPRTTAVVALSLQVKYYRVIRLSDKLVRRTSMTRGSLSAEALGSDGQTTGSRTRALAS